MAEVFDKISEFVEAGLSISLEHLLIQLAATLILFIIVRCFLWKRITNLLEARRELALKNLEDAKLKSEQTSKLLENSRLEYMAAKTKAKEILDYATSQAKMEKQEIIEEAKKEARQRLENVQDEITLEINKQKNTLKKEIVEIAFLAAEKIVKKEINKNEHLNAIENFLDEVGK